MGETLLPVSASINPPPLCLINPLALLAHIGWQHVPVPGGLAGQPGVVTPYTDVALPAGSSFSVCASFNGSVVTGLLVVDGVVRDSAESQARIPRSGGVRHAQVSRHRPRAWLTSPSMASETQFLYGNHPFSLTRPTAMVQSCGGRHRDAPQCPPLANGDDVSDCKRSYAGDGSGVMVQA